MYTKNKKSAN